MGQDMRFMDSPHDQAHRLVFEACKRERSKLPPAVREVFDKQAVTLENWHRMMCGKEPMTMPQETSWLANLR